MNLREGYAKNRENNLTQLQLLKDKIAEKKAKQDIRDHKRHLQLKQEQKEHIQLVKQTKSRRPQPLLLGYNEFGVTNNRKVLYRQFHEVSK